MAVTDSPDLRTPALWLARGVGALLLCSSAACWRQARTPDELLAHALVEALESSELPQLAAARTLAGELLGTGQQRSLRLEEQWETASGSGALVAIFSGAGTERLFFQYRESAPELDLVACYPTGGSGCCLLLERDGAILTPQRELYRPGIDTGCMIMTEAEWEALMAKTFHDLRDTLQRDFAPRLQAGSGPIWLYADPALPLKYVDRILEQAVTCGLGADSFCLVDLERGVAFPLEVAMLRSDEDRERLDSEDVCIFVTVLGDWKERAAGTTQPVGWPHGSYEEHRLRYEIRDSRFERVEDLLSHLAMEREPNARIVLDFMKDAIVCDCLDLADGLRRSGFSQVALREDKF